MTRSSKLALVTLLAGLLSLVPISAVTADSGCTRYAPEHCEAMAAANDAVLYRITEVASPVHVFSAYGPGQEHFEAMSVAQPDTFSVTSPTPVVVMSEQQNTITLPSAGTTPDFTEQQVQEFDAITAIDQSATSNDRFIGNTSVPYMEDFTPETGQNR